MAALLPEATGEVPPGDSALPMTAMRQGAGRPVARGVCRAAGTGVVPLGSSRRRRPTLRLDRDPGQPVPGRGRRAHPVLYLPCLFPRPGPRGGAARWAESGRGLVLRRERSGDAERRGAGGWTMRPAEARAARVGQGGARVAECVCVRLSVKADSPQLIGQALLARPALRRLPLAGLNTKAPARPALRVGLVVPAWEGGASTTFGL